MERFIPARWFCAMHSAFLHSENSRGTRFAAAACTGYRQPADGSTARCAVAAVRGGFVAARRELEHTSFQKSSLSEKGVHRTSDVVPRARLHPHLQPKKDRWAHPPAEFKLLQQIYGKSPRARKPLLHRWQASYKDWCPCNIRPRPPVNAEAVRVAEGNYRVSAGPATLRLGGGCCRNCGIGQRTAGLPDRKARPKRHGLLRPQGGFDGLDARQTYPARSVRSQRLDWSN